MQNLKSEHQHTQCSFIIMCLWGHFTPDRKCPIKFYLSQTQEIN
uniref:Uncharacterized protein n=1 Tax=Anguilla anguilla TaxID=7936 RepID=A0A0E9SNW9_ANGAN